MGLALVLLELVLVGLLGFNKNVRTVVCDALLYSAVSGKKN